MKLTYRGERGLEFVATNPDESLIAVWRDKIFAAYRQEAMAFIEEVAVTLRKLPPGKRVMVRSKPIEVTLEKGTDDQKESGAESK